MRTLLKLGIPFALFFIISGEAIAQTATVVSTRANLRETPSQSGAVKQEVPMDTEIKVLDSKGPWYVVRVDDTVGWMHGSTFRFADASPTTSEAETPVPSTGIRTTSVGDSPSTPSTSSKGPYIEGPRGGCYYYSASGNKVYVDRSLCGSSSAEVAPVTSSNTPASGGYNRGPRGGCYRYSRTGKKVYVDRGRCS
jgi:hypothetical protein